MIDFFILGCYCNVIRDNNMKKIVLLLVMFGCVLFIVCLFVFQIEKNNFEDVYVFIMLEKIVLLLKILVFDEFEGCLFIIEGECKMFEYFILEFKCMGL